MARKVEIEYPESGITVVASLLEKEQPEASELLWNFIEKPVRCACYNTASTGYMFIGKTKPPKEPVRIGTQAVPVGSNPKYLCDLKAGEILFTGLDFWCNYGKNTEPLLGSGSVTMVVDPECLDDFIKAGMFIWNCQQVTHKLATMNVRRKEN